MIDRLRQPGGRLGTLSLVSALLLGAIGIAGVITMLVVLPMDSDFWSDKDSDLVIAAALFAVTALGGLGVWATANVTRWVISSYVLANEAQVKRGILLSFISAMLQSLVAIAFEGVVCVLMAQRRPDVLSIPPLTRDFATSAYQLIE